MSKYTARQVRDWHTEAHLACLDREDYESAQEHGDMADAIDDLLRERKSAKAAVTWEMVEIAVNAHADWFGGHRGMRAALEAVVPMLASARVPDEMKTAPPSPLHSLWGDGFLEGWNMCRDTMLAMTPKPEKEWEWDE